MNHSFTRMTHAADGRMVRHAPTMTMMPVIEMMIDDSGRSLVELTLDLDLGIRLVIQKRASIVGESPSPMPHPFI